MLYTICLRMTSVERAVYMINIVSRLYTNNATQCFYNFFAFITVYINFSVLISITLVLANFIYVHSRFEFKLGRIAGILSTIQNSKMCHANHHHTVFIHE
jgi:hypothetical protein